MMEVLHRPGSYFVSQPASIYSANIQGVFSTPADVYTCYPFHLNTPSRSPTPERPFRTMVGPPSGNQDFSSHASLHSVLRCDLPSSFSHLRVPGTVHPHHSTPRYPYLSSVDTPAFTDSNPRHLSISPSLSVLSSLSQSPRPSSRESSTSQDSSGELQTEPMDLSFKRSRKRSAASARLDSSTHFSSSLPTKLCSRTPPSDFSSSPPSSSPYSHSTHRFLNSPDDSQHGEFSLLRNLLSVGKNHLSLDNPGSLSHSTPNLASDRSCDSPPRVSVTGSTKVQLAKKNLLPVSARVSDWLVKMVQFSKSIPEFSTLPYNDQVTLILHSWPKIILLYMAESNFQFAVSPVRTEESPLPPKETVSSPEEPTMKSVEGLQKFIKKCQQMAVDAKEYEYFRMLVLFNSGCPGLARPDTVDHLNSVVQQLLQQHVRVTRPRDILHYSRLLLCLPALYSTNCRQFQSLFCQHISQTTDMEVLLKEMLHSVS